MIKIQTPSIQCIEDASNPKSMNFVIEPLERGFGTTLGNSMRRILLSTLPGAAAVGIKIVGATHEFAHIDGVKEDVTDIILNIKGLAVKAFTDDINFTTQCEINKHTAGIVTAADIIHGSEIEILNPDLYICTLDEGANLELTIYIGMGRGYVAATEHNKSASAYSQDASYISIDSIYTPVETASYTVESARLGGDMSYEKLTISVTTTGTYTPKEVISLAADILEKQVHLFTELSTSAPSVELENAKKGGAGVEKETTSIDELELTVRPYNCLKRASINTIEDLCKKTEDDLMRVKNLGRRSVNEIIEKLTTLGYSLRNKEDI